MGSVFVFCSAQKDTRAPVDYPCQISNVVFYYRNVVHTFEPSLVPRHHHHPTTAAAAATCHHRYTIYKSVTQCNCVRTPIERDLVEIHVFALKNYFLLVPMIINRFVRFFWNVFTNYAHMKNVCYAGGPYGYRLFRVRLTFSVHM